MFITKEKLLKVGFEIVTDGKEEFLAIDLKRGKDRFNYQLLWYADDPNSLLIVAHTPSGLYCIKESNFLKNHNVLSSSAVAHYLEIMEALK